MRIAKIHLLCSKARGICGKIKMCNKQKERRKAYVCHCF